MRESLDDKNRERFRSNAVAPFALVNGHLKIPFFCFRKDGQLQRNVRIPRDDVSGFILHLEEYLKFLMKKHQVPGVSLTLVKGTDRVSGGFRLRRSGKRRTADRGYAHAGAVDFETRHRLGCVQPR